MVGISPGNESPQSEASDAAVQIDLFENLSARLAGFRDPSIAVIDDAPGWDNSEVYTGFNDPKFLKDEERCLALITAIEASSPKINSLLLTAESLTLDQATSHLPEIRLLTLMELEAYATVRNLEAFVDSRAYVDQTDSEAQDVEGRVNQIKASLAKARGPLARLLKSIPESTFDALTTDPDLAELKPILSHDRSLRDFLLPLEIERVLEDTRITALTNWGRAYRQILSSITCQVETDQGEIKGLVRVGKLLQENPEEEVRRVAYQARAEAVEPHLTTLAHTLCNIRVAKATENKLRSGKKKVHFLDESLHANRISRESLEAMNTAIREKRSELQEGVSIMAKGLGKDRLEPWNLQAPAPSHIGRNRNESSMSFAQAVSFLKDAFARFDPHYADFVDLMLERRWVEARVLEHKIVGSNAITFAEPRSPRIFTSYTGGPKSVISLGHEFGHAFHSWEMRDLNFYLTDNLPMTLHEIASYFFESLAIEHMTSHGGAFSNGKILGAWESVKQSVNLLLSMSVRFDFEARLYEATKGQKILSPKELNSIIAEFTQFWFGDTLTEPNLYIWATTLHNYFTEPEWSFYNYPYKAGYLLSRMIYALRAEIGDAETSKLLRLILRDSARYSVEALFDRHLGIDLREPAPWKKGVAVDIQDILRLKRLMAQAA